MGPAARPRRHRRRLELSGFLLTVLGIAAFVAGRLSFRGIVDLVARTLDDAPDLGAPTCVEDVLAAEKWAREHARGVISGGRS